jgi:hypothetical protein
MNSRDYYQILHGYDVELYLGPEGIRKCQIFVKLTESLTDVLVVEYTNGTRRKVAGQYLFTSKEDVLKWVDEQKTLKINDIAFAIQQLTADLENIHKQYSRILIEN